MNYSLEPLQISISMEFLSRIIGISWMKGIYFGKNKVWFHIIYVGIIHEVYLKIYFVGEGKGI